MSDGTASKSLVELARHAYGQTNKSGEFNLKAAGLGVEGSHGSPAGHFVNGDYNGKEQYDPNLNLNKTMESLGQKLIAQAKKEGVDIAALAGVSDLDFNKNGKLDPKEVGAIFLAATMDTHVETGEFNKGGVVSKLFETTHAGKPGKLGQGAADAAKLIAKQLLHDNGAKIAAESDADFNKSVKNNKSVNKRDTSESFDRL